MALDWPRGKFVFWGPRPKGPWSWALGHMAQEPMNSWALILPMGALFVPRRFIWRERLDVCLFVLEALAKQHSGTQLLCKLSQKAVDMTPAKRRQWFRALKADLQAAQALWALWLRGGI